MPSKAFQRATAEIDLSPYAIAADHVPNTRSIGVSGLATGGGTLSANRTITVTAASQAEAEAGTAANRTMTPQRTAQAIAALAMAGVLPGVESFTANGTWTKPADLMYVVVHVYGGGSSGANTNGGTSSFGTHCQATGSYNTTAGEGSGGDVNLPGHRGAQYNGGESGPLVNVAGGTPGPFGADTTIIPGNQESRFPGGGSALASGGGYSRKTILADDLDATVAVTVAAGGGSTGGKGWVLVEEYLSA